MIKCIYFGNMLQRIRKRAAAPFLQFKCIIIVGAPAPCSANECDDNEKKEGDAAKKDGGFDNHRAPLPLHFRHIRALFLHTFDLTGRNMLFLAFWHVAIRPNVSPSCEAPNTTPCWIARPLSTSWLSCWVPAVVVVVVLLLLYHRPFRKVIPQKALVSMYRPAAYT